MPSRLAVSRLRPRLPVPDQKLFATGKAVIQPSSLVLRHMSPIDGLFHGDGEVIDDVMPRIDFVVCVVGGEPDYFSVRCEVEFGSGGREARFESEEHEDARVKVSVLERSVTTQVQWFGNGKRGPRLRSEVVQRGASKWPMST